MHLLRVVSLPEGQRSRPSVAKAIELTNPPTEVLGVLEWDEESAGVCDVTGEIFPASHGEMTVTVRRTGR